MAIGDTTPNSLYWARRLMMNTTALPRANLGQTGLTIPRVVFGTSCLGNLYEALPWDAKRAILREFFQHVPAPVALDSAGKYGAGLALETVGRGLRELNVTADQLLLSNKLGWYRVPLRGPAPTFEPGVWADLEYDAEQRISYAGILACWEQGWQLVGAPYGTQLVSVHDPDEYLAGAADPVARWDDLLGAYRALHELRDRGAARAVGVGAKDWRVIRKLADAVALDWVMLACSFTIYRHSPELLVFMETLHRRGIGIINSAVFHAGFLIGGRYFDYRIPTPATDAPLFAWREQFLALCRQHAVAPATACVQFGLSAPGIAAVSLNTGRPERVRENVALVQTAVPAAFWSAMKDAGLIARDYPYL